MSDILCWKVVHTDPHHHTHTHTHTHTLVTGYEMFDIDLRVWYDMLQYLIRYSIVCGRSQLAVVCHSPSAWLGLRGIGLLLRKYLRKWIGYTLGYIHKIVTQQVGWIQ